MNNIKKGTRLYINLTNHCNVNCPFCCMWSGTKKNTFMKFDTFKKIIDKCDGYFELQLEGGEPILNKDIFLFLEYAVSTGRCLKVIVLTNGILINKYVDRLISFANWNNILVELKISINYYLIKTQENFLDNLNLLKFSTHYMPNINIKFNVRKRKNIDSNIDELLKKYDLYDSSNIYYFQSYGKMKNSNYDKPVIVQNIENWRIYSCDGKCFNQDLVARSDYEETLE